MNKKEVYQINKNPADDQPKGFYPTLKNKSDNVASTDKDFDKIAINFIKIEALCIKRYMIFFFKSKLYNHLKSGYLEVTLPFFLTQTASSIPIIAFKAIFQSFSSELIFRG